jgi:hypothetical protein
MKKKAYKTVDVKKVNVDALSEKVNGQSIVLGIDVAKTDFVASIILLCHIVTPS